MKPEHMYLDQLNPKSKAYKVKVKVIEKSRPKVSPKKGVAYQTLLLEDEKGNRMRGALFGDQVEGYKEAIAYKGEYEIANASIKPVDDQWKTNPTELGYQMSFGRHTVIQPVNFEAGPILPDYQCIASVPRAWDPSDKYDILGIVLYIEDSPCTVVVGKERENLVREIVITDHSTAQPLIISAWNDLTGAACDSLSSYAEKSIIVGLTALRASSHKGFSLASTMSTMIIHDPAGDKANALREWAKKNQDMLADRQTRVLAVKNPSQERIIMTIVALKEKKVCDTFQEERHWLRVVVPDPEIDKIHAYLGCSTCGKRGDVPLGKIYSCTGCSKKDATSSTRVTFNFTVSDGTGALPVTTFTEDSEKLLGSSAANIYSLKQSGDHNAFQDIMQLLQTKQFLIEVGPTTTLSINNILQWCLKSLVLEDEDTK